MESRFVDTDLWMQTLKGILAEGKEAPLNVTGNSMMPFLHHGRDKVLLKTPDTSAIRKGSILLYQRADGHYILHRVVRIRNGAYFFAGDAQSVVEGPILPSQIVAMVTAVSRNGQTLRKGNPTWWFYQTLWRYTLPFRKAIIAVYLKIFAKRKK